MILSKLSMYVVAIKVSDFLFNIGNHVFNVKDVKYKGGNDLDYEESKSLPINKVFRSIDGNVKRVEKSTGSILASIFGFFSKKKTVSPSKKEKLVRVDNYRKSDSYNSCSAHTVISNNVRNRLLKTINEDSCSYGLNTTNRKTSKARPKKLKNQFIDKSNII